MKTIVSVGILMLGAMMVFSGSTPTLVTGADADVFKAHIGKVVELRGRLEEGKEGLCVVATICTNVRFYVVPYRPTQSTWTYPTAWSRLVHKPVKVVGELHFRAFDQAGKDPRTQSPPDYYYMVLQHTEVDPLEPQVVDDRLEAVAKDYVKEHGIEFDFACTWPSVHLSTNKNGLVRTNIRFWHGLLKPVLSIDIDSNGTVTSCLVGTQLDDLYSR